MMTNPMHQQKVFNVLDQTGHDQNKDLSTKKVQNMIFKIILSFGALGEGSTPAATCLSKNLDL